MIKEIKAAQKKLKTHLLKGYAFYVLMIFVKDVKMKKNSIIINAI